MSAQVRPAEEEEEEEPGSPGLFSNSHTVLILTVVVGCFGVLWPKIFSPMFFGDQQDQRDSMPDLSEESLSSCERTQNTPPVRGLITVIVVVGGGGGGGLFPEHPNPAMRARMGGMGGPQPHPGMGGGQARPVRTIDKEWPDKHPRPGMRPTLGGPGIQPSQKQQATGSMGVVMPIYTVAILVFFIYTIVKVKPSFLASYHQSNII